MSALAMGFTIIGHQLHHLKIISEQYLPLLTNSESPVLSNGADLDCYPEKTML